MADGRRGATIVLAVSVVAIAISVVATGVRLSSPSSGTAIATSGQPFTPDGVRIDVLAGAVTPLRQGDVVVGMADRSTLDWAAAIVGGDGERLSVELGDTVRFEVERAGTPVEVDVPLIAYPTVDMLVTAWGTLLFVVALLVVAAIVFGRRPTVPAAGALLLAGVGAAGSTLPYLLGQDPLDVATGVYPVSLFSSGFVYLLLWAGLIDFVLVFPRPYAAVARRPELRAVPYLAMYGGFLAGLAITWTTAPTALAWLGAWGPLTLLATIATVVVTPFLMFHRWRRGPLEDRPLLRSGIAVMGFIAVADLVVWIVPEALGGHALLPWTIAGLTGLPFVAFIGVAILRHRAFDIDVVVRRSVVYGGLTVAVIATYAVVAALLGAVLGGVSPFATTLLATGAAAIIALPVRDGLQRATSRRLYGDRDEPVRAIRRLGERLEWSIDPDAMPRVVVDTVADALRLPYVALELGSDPGARLAAEHGSRPDELTARLLTFHSRPVGRLLAAARGPGDPLSEADLRLLDDLTRQIGIAAHAALLTEDLRASRERIVAAREEERRRLRRDLHDGLGPTLAAIGMRAEAAEGEIRSDPEHAEHLLAELRSEVSTAVGDIRRLVDGLRPPAIDELGLVGALRLAGDGLSVAGTPQVSVEAEGAFDDLPAAVEVAAFRIASEAMTNAVRHAGARHCSVRLAAERELTVTVEDDGRGLPEDRRDGVGLISIHERAAELGGDVAVEPRPGGGTRVVARLPVALQPGGAEP